MKIIPLSQQKKFNGKMPYGITKILKGNELSLYIMLLEHHNSHYGYAYPTYKEIREYFGKGWDNKRIRGYLNGLEEKGLVVVGKNKKKIGYDNNIYMINVPCYEDENKLIKELNVIEYEINKLDVGIETYLNSIKRESNNVHLEYLKSEIDILENQKKSLLSHQQELSKKINILN